MKSTELSALQATATWYLNASSFMYHDAVGHGKNQVTMARVNAFNKIQQRLISVSQFVERHRSLHVVREFSTSEGYLRLVCDCAGFWNSASYGSHVVAIYHHLGLINVYNMMSALMPVRKRGRPTCREKALERDKDGLHEMSIRPATVRKTNIRHHEYRNGLVYQYRTLPDKKGTHVWKVRFPDAPGGTQDFEMNEEELNSAKALYKQWFDACAKITAEDGDI